MLFQTWILQEYIDELFHWSTKSQESSGVMVQICVKNILNLKWLYNENQPKGFIHESYMVLEFTLTQWSGRNG